MVVLDSKYHDEDDLTPPSTDDPTDAPPPYNDVPPAHSGQRPNRGPAYVAVPKRPPPSTNLASRSSRGSFPSGAQVDTTPRPASGHSQPGPSSWLSRSSLTTSRTSKQVQQTVVALVRALVLDAESPDLLSSCADACRTYGLDLSALLQERTIENHSAIYWAILNRRDALLQSLLVRAAPLSQSTVSDIRLACLTTSNQDLFQSLRRQREPFAKGMMPLSTSPGADTLVLGSTPADQVSIREVDGRGAFVAEMRMNLWQKRMRISGRVSVEFIARGRIWSLTFFSPSSTAHTAVGMWRIALCLLEHSPPTFVDSRLVIDLPPSSSNMSTTLADTSQTGDLISLSPPPDAATDAVESPPPTSPLPSNEFKLKSKALKSIQVRLKSGYRLAYHASNTFPAALDGSPPRVEQWSDDAGVNYTNVIVVPLDDGSGAELLYDNTPYIATDGALLARLEARLGKADATECVIG